MIIIIYFTRLVYNLQKEKQGVLIAVRRISIFLIIPILLFIISMFLPRLFYISDFQPTILFLIMGIPLIMLASVLKKAQQKTLFTTRITSSFLLIITLFFMISFSVNINIIEQEARAVIFCLIIYIIILLPHFITTYYIFKSKTIKEFFINND